MKAPVEGITYARRVAAAVAGPVIDVRGLHKTYQDGTHAVRGVSFQVRQGEIFGLLGPNGAGKTTLMRILGTLHPATEGAASVLGHDVHTDAHAVRKQIGFAMQEVGMDDLATADEMLRFHARLYGMSSGEAKAKARDLLRTFDLQEHAKRRVTRFSGGMQRRLDLAVSLIHSPRVLFLDEPSTGLDPTSRQDLWNVLRRLRRSHNITILMSTHYMEEADVLCDRIAVMNDGKIAAIDTPENLKRLVGVDRIHIELAAPAGPEAVAQLGQLFGPRNYRLRGNVLEVGVRDGGRSLMPTLEAVNRAGLHIAGTEVIKPTLDDVFLRFTGARLGADGPSEADA